MRRVDPDGGWLLRRAGWFFDDAFWMGGEGSIQGDLAGGVNGVGLAVMHLVGCHQAETSMVMRLVVPCEECAAEYFGVLDAAEEFLECRLIFQGLEVAFRERIVVGDMRPAVGRARGG